MKRDLMVVYRILDKVERSSYDISDPAPIPVIIPSVAHEVIQYHLLLLSEAKLIETIISESGMLAPTRLTWRGHDYLDNASDVIIDGIDDVFAEISL